MENKGRMEQFMDAVVQNDALHGKWLNTLSMMENSGARKIKRCEHPVFVNELILKHASEESRHAYYLKKQIAKVALGQYPTYEAQYIFSPKQSHWYLDALDIQICRYLKATYSYQSEQLKYAAYLLVTFAIEVRADALYPIYQSSLDKVNSKVNVKSIIAEEIGHLAEMRKQIADLFADPENVSNKVIDMEARLYADWVESLAAEIGLG